MKSNKKGEWCYCTLTVACHASHDQIEELDAFVKAVKDYDDKSDLSFHRLIRVPQILIENYYHKSDKVKNRNFGLCGYETLEEFTNENWGCAYDPVDVIHSKLDDTAHQYEFMTRSVPPEIWISEVSAIYPNLEFNLEAINEMDLWEDFSCSYINGSQKYHKFKKNQPKVQN